ncbi:MAG: SsrA-binding protein SmpB [bacterium]|nr:SsrA-binding protein SmpB [bacterium]
MNTARHQPISTIVTNRRARHDYHIVETFEAGIELRGTEVKSLRAHQCSLNDAFAKIEHGEAILYNFHISPYEQANRFNHDPLRPRRLLLHKNEIARLAGRTERKGMALIPLKLYFKGPRAKVELALAQGKVQHDKREDIKKREHTREITRAIARINIR